MDQIRNLSIRKTIVLYMALCLFIGFFFSAFIARTAEGIQNRIWWKYVDEEEYFTLAEGEGIRYMTDLPRPDADEMTEADHFVSELCDFLQTFTVLVVSVFGSVIAVFLFYRNKLKPPIEELHLASQKISRNELDFHITYKNRDEMGRLCVEFERMREQLEENNRELWKNIEDEKALRSAIAHDIRSPLSVLKGYQEMLLEYVPDGTIGEEQAAEMLAECAKQTGRIDRFVETMRKLSSLENRELAVSQIRMEELATDLEAEARILEQDSEKHIILKIPDTEDIFQGDKEVILEVVENLLSNALRYARHQVEVTAEIEGTELKIRVEDDGTGLQGNFDQVTKLYYQKNAKDSLEHAGMGMYISRLYCEKHKGRLLLENGKYGGAAIIAVFDRIA